MHAKNTNTEFIALTRLLLENRGIRGDRLKKIGQKWGNLQNFDTAE